MPMIFNANYTLTLKISCSESIKLFNEHFDNMDKKGYSSSTLILNSDHYDCNFSGVIRDNTFLVRCCQGYSDMVYRFSPLHKINFAVKDDLTEISVKCVNKRMLTLFIIFVVLFVLLLCLAVFSVINSVMPLFVNVLLIVVPVIFMAVIILISKSQLNDFKSSLLYIFRDYAVK